MVDLTERVNVSIAPALDLVSTTGGTKLVNDGARPGGGTFNKTKATALFDKYKIAGSYLMEQDEVDKFFSDIGVNAETDIVCLMASFHMKAMTMGELKKDEFLTGCEALGCDDIQSW